MSTSPRTAARRSPSSPRIRIGCAGWSLRSDQRGLFPTEGSHLARYAARFSAAEINSSFYRSHRPATYARWAESTPADFRFAVKMPKLVTHELRWRRCAKPLAQFFGEIAALGAKLGCVLIQIPPSFAFESALAARFLADVRKRAGETPVALEPRHASWFGPAAAALLVRTRIARVAADPARVPEAAVPGGDGTIAYYRLHGSPRMYYSRYEPAYLATLARTLRRHAREGKAAWCIFDNTTLGHASDNALALATLVEGRQRAARVTTPPSAGPRSRR